MNPNAEDFDAPHLRYYVFDDPPMTPDALYALRWKTYVYPCLGSWHVLQQSRHVYHEFPEFYKVVKFIHGPAIHKWTFPLPHLAFLIPILSFEKNNLAYKSTTQVLQKHSALK